MALPVLGVRARPVWRRVGVGSGAVGIAERDALGTTARLVAWPPQNLGRILGAVDAELARLDLEASRFRADSEISAIHRDGAAIHPISEGLAEAIGVALAAARWTGGLVDPTVGGALCSLGYDRDFARIDPGRDAAPVAPAPVPGWQSIRLDGCLLRLPAGVWLDLGATAKGLGSDRAACTAFMAAGSGGVLVSLGGDIAIAGQTPAGGWPLLVADEHRHASTSGAGRSPAQLVRLASGALATSSVTCRQWRRAGQLLHHIVDPRTGLPARGPWRTVSVAAASCAEANAASTAAIIAGDQAEAWLTAEALPGRLVTYDGRVRFTGGWPVTQGGRLDAPPARLLQAGSAREAGRR
jgi:thiamine biosynthesis lipoprotein